jgi:hypothetical protein
MQRKCPKCGSLDVRRSAVRVSNVELHHILLSPYRCRGCRALFWVVSRRVLHLAVIVGVALALGAIGFALWGTDGQPGHASEKLPAEAVRTEETLQLAAKQDPRAEYEVAKMHGEGRGVPRDDKARLTWLERAAEHGNADAQYEFGMALRDGRGTLQDYGRAATLLQQAAEAGNGYAQFELGVMYRNGVGLAADNAKAYTWFNLAAAQGVAGADVARDLALRQLSTPEAVAAQAEARRLSGARAASAPNKAP